MYVESYDDTVNMCFFIRFAIPTEGAVCKFDTDIVFFHEGFPNHSDLLSLCNGIG